VILYLDTSALVKLYVDEPGRDAVLELLEETARCATARIAYVEARAAFARKRREGGFDARGLRCVVDLLDADWAAFALVEVTESLVRRAGLLAERCGLRGYDAVHLAAACEIAGAGGDVVMACFDERLQRACEAAEASRSAFAGVGAIFETDGAPFGPLRDVFQLQELERQANRGRALAIAGVPR